MDILNGPLCQFVISVVLLAGLAPIIIWFFRDTWASLDAAAGAHRRERQGRLDARTPATILLAAFCLILINYFGSLEFFDTQIVPVLKRYEVAHPQTLDLRLYEDLYWRIYWGLSRYLAYLLPLAVWPLVFKENPLDLGLRVRGFLEHAWIYLLCLVVVIPVLALVAHMGDFGTYYPMYHLASRSWLDLAVWEVLYVGQFFTLEVFFRGFWLRGSRALGSNAIFFMVGPYVMIHFPKPYLEACGALVAGVVLGSLSMKTRSIWAGFLVHATVAILMDLLALDHRHALPTRLTPTSSVRLAFPYASAVLFAVWILAGAGLAFAIWRRHGRRDDGRQNSGVCPT
jgi:membrane protease YdiL (CAAX protease family)